MHIVKNYLHFELYYFGQLMIFQHMNLSGYSTKGHKACPICGEDTFFVQLRHERKTVYLGTRRFLPMSHHYQRLQKAFNGSTEEEKAPKFLMNKYMKGWNILCQVVKKLSKIQLKRMYGRSDLYFLTSRSGSVCLWDTALMLCILRKMCVIILLEHYSIYAVRLRIESKVDWIWLKWVYVST